MLKPLKSAKLLKVLYSEIMKLQNSYIFTSYITTIIHSYIPLFLQCYIPTFLQYSWNWLRPSFGLLWWNFTNKIYKICFMMYLTSQIIRKQHEKSNLRQSQFPKKRGGGSGKVWSWSQIQCGFKTFPKAWSDCFPF